MHDAGWGWWLFSGLGMLAIWALVIYGVLWLVRGANGQASKPQQDDEAPQETLKRRLASGEISVEEYERVSHTLEGEPPAQRAEPALH